MGDPVGSKMLAEFLYSYSKMLSKQLPEIESSNGEMYLFGVSFWLPSITMKSW